MRGVFPDVDVGVCGWGVGALVVAVPEVDNVRQVVLFGDGFVRPGEEQFFDWTSPDGVVAVFFQFSHSGGIG